MYLLHKEVIPASLNKSRMMGQDSFYVWSVKLNREVIWQSQWEYHYWLLVESNPEVIQFCERYPTLVDPLTPSKDPYSFDMWVKYEDGQEHCVDICAQNETAEDMDGNQVPIAWTQITSSINTLGLQCRVITEQVLGKEKKRIQNWQQIMPFVRMAGTSPSEKLQEKLLDLVSHRREATLEEIILSLPSVDSNTVIQQMFWLLYQGKVNAPHIHSAPVSMSFIFTSATE